MGGYFIVRSAAIRRIPKSAYWLLLYEHLRNGCSAAVLVDTIRGATMSSSSLAEKMPYVMEVLWKPLFTCDGKCNTDEPQLPVGPPQLECWPKGTRAILNGSYPAFSRLGRL